ncbi:MAG: hypothetical protein ACLU38_05410 [Dysosmobacter sp.]
MNILAFESSCDETAVAVVRGRADACCRTPSRRRRICTRSYGGVVPEIASRKHVEAIAELTDKALADAGVTGGDIDAVAVTYAPGLIGAVLVGLSFAKSVAYAPGRAAHPGAPYPRPHRRELSGVPGAGAAVPGAVHVRRQHAVRGRAGLYRP